MTDGYTVYMCNCDTPHPVIILDDDHGYCLMRALHQGGKWTRYREVMHMKTPHPDPDAVWADYCAAQMTGDTHDATL